MNKFPILLILICCSIFACNSNKDLASTKSAMEENPAAAGFNLEASDAKAIALADTVMSKMGGRKNWDNTRYIHWNFFGRRTLLWDKWEGKVRIEILEDKTIYLVDVNNDSGQVFKDGMAISQPDSLKKYIGKGKSIWINDSYWLVMPFKLKDSGVTLKYQGSAATKEGEDAEVLALTFENVGDTPQNKYQVYVDKSTGLVCQWDFFTNATDPEPRFSTPWKDYKTFGNILLSGERGMAQLTEIKVLESIPEAAFTSFEPVQLD